MTVSTAASPSGISVKIRRGRIARALHMGRDEWRAVAEAQWQLLAAQCLVWRRPIGELIAQRFASESTPPIPMTPQQWQSASAAAVAIRRAAEHGVFRPRCLVRSMALTRMLDGRGIRASRIEIGVRASADRFAAHAWVELGGRVLGDVPQHTGSFVQVATIRIV